MKLVRSILLVLFAISLFGCGGNAIEADMATRGPNGMTLTLPTNFSPNETITGTVTIAPAAVGDQTITLSFTPAGSFSSIPVTVTVPNGASSVNFSATMSSSASGQVNVTATNNGRMVTRAMWGV